METRVGNAVWTTHAIGVSWGSILAGAVAAAALSLILLALGSGLGLAAVSPWAYEGASAAGIGVGAIAWLLVMAVIASAMGGYLAGRLRPKWTAVPDDETFFRDTAHGFLAWAVATIVSAGLLTSAATAMVGTATKAIGGAAEAAVVAAGSTAATSASSGSSELPSPQDYFVDMLYRGARPADMSADSRALRSEANTIFAYALEQGDFSPGDRAYLTQLVAQRTGLSPTEADARVNQVITAAKTAREATIAKAKSTAEQARKATLYAALWVFISLLLGAFSASFAATVGGRQRDAWAPSSI